MITHEQQTRTIWRCDGPAIWVEEGTHHSEEDVTDYADPDQGPEGWTRLKNGKTLCLRCSEAELCAASGHQMFGWGVHGSGEEAWGFNFCTRHCGYWESAGASDYVSPHLHLAVGDVPPGDIRMTTTPTPDRPHDDWLAGEASA